MSLSLRVSLIVSCVAVAALQYLDAAATVLVLRAHGHEANPLTAAVLVHWGLAGLLLEKTLAIGCCVAAFTLAAVYHRYAPRLYSVAVVCSYAWLCAVIYLDLHRVVHLI